nr:MAG TPA: hypothetical protein [Bacteriophage sp.]
MLIRWKRIRIGTPKESGKMKALRRNPGNFIYKVISSV